jgi:anti-sigma regulatory factor (Ser/Thr protein kinase)
MRIIGAVHLPGSPTAPREARRFLRQVTTRAELGLDAETIGDIELCVGELAANAYAHTASGRGGHMMISVAADHRRVRVTVIDDGGAPTVPQIQDEFFDEGGRGLRLVESLADAWGVHDLPGGTAVWTQFATSAPDFGHRQADHGHEQEQRAGQGGGGEPFAEQCDGYQGGAHRLQQHDH